MPSLKGLLRKMKLLGDLPRYVRQCSYERGLEFCLRNGFKCVENFSRSHGLHRIKPGFVLTMKKTLYVGALPSFSRLLFLFFPHFCCSEGKEAGDQRAEQMKIQPKTLPVITANSLGKMNCRPGTETDKNPRSVLMLNHLKSENKPQERLFHPS